MIHLHAASNGLFNRPGHRGWFPHLFFSSAEMMRINRCALGTADKRIRAI